MMSRTICMVVLATVMAGSAGVGWAQVAGGASGTGAGLAGSGESGLRKRPMTFADLQRMKRVSDPQISPSGKWVMFSVVDVDLEKNSKVSHLWVVPLDVPGGGEPISQNRDMAHPTVAREKQVTFWKEGESGGRFSPDGRQVLFVANDAATGLSQIFLAAWDEASGTLGTPVRLTNVSTEADGAVWSPNSKRILFASRVYPECSDEATWVEEDACDKRKDDAAAASPVKAQVWDHLLYRHWDHYVGVKRSHVLVVSATDGNAVRDLTPRRDIGDAEAPVFSLGGPLGYAWAPRSEEISFVTNLDLVPAASTNNDVFTLLLDDPGSRPRKISTSLGSDDGPAYSPDGKYIAFRSQARAGYESDRFRLMVFDRLAGTTKEFIQKLNRPKGADFDDWVDEFVWAPDSLALFFTSGVQGNEAIFRHSFSKNYSGAETDFVRLTDRGEFGDIHAFTEPAHEFVELVATKMTIDSPPEVVITGLGVNSHEMREIGMPIGERVPPAPMVQEDFAKEVQLTHLNDAILRPLELPKMESYWFTGAEGAKVQGFVIRPPNFDASRKYPVKFLIHGGPQGAWGDAWSYRWNPELMAASGYVVVMVNPRGSTGYGQAFIDGVNGDWGGKAYVDLMKGLDYAEQHYPFIDKTRECALGGSYGGFMADWMLTHTDRFACIVTHDGMFNPQSAYGDTDELWFNEWEFRRPAGAGSTKARGSAAVAADGPGQPWKYAAGPVADDPFRKWSPMLSIQNAKTPTLVIHSRRDYRLDVSEGMQLFTALQRLNVPSRMLYFPDEGHWVLKPQNSRLWYEEVGAWCDRWTKNTGYGKALAAPVRSVESAPMAAAAARPLVAAPSPTATVVPQASASAAPASRPRVEADPQTTGAGATFSIAISAPQGEVRVGEDVLRIAMTNVSNRQLLLGHKPGRENGELSFDVEVKDEAGRQVAETVYGREARDAGRRREEDSTVEFVQPGGTAVQMVHLGKIVNLRPGSYTVQVSRRDAAKGVVVRSNLVTINVR